MNGSYFIIYSKKETNIMSFQDKIDVKEALDQP